MDTLKAEAGKKVEIHFRKPMVLYDHVEGVNKIIESGFYRATWILNPYSDNASLFLCLDGLSLGDTEEFWKALLLDPVRNESVIITE